MRAVILAVVCGLALATTPLQAAPVPTKALPGEPASALPSSWHPKAADAGWHRVPVVGRACSHWRA